MLKLGPRYFERFSLLELMVVLVVLALLSSLAVPAYNQFVSQAKVAKASGDIQTMHVKLEAFRLKNNDQLPAALNELNMEIPVDAWGQAYVYLNILTAGPGNGGGSGTRCAARPAC